MKINPFFIHCLLFVLLLSQQSKLQGQSIWFHFNNGLQDAHNLSDIQKITYGTPNINAISLTLTSGSIITYAYSDIERFNFLDNSVGISQKSELNANRIHVFPNPASSEITVNWICTEPASTALEIRDMGGRIIDTHFLPEGGTGLRTYLLTVDKLPPGIYLLQLLDKESVLSTRIVIN